MSDEKKFQKLEDVDLEKVTGGDQDLFICLRDYIINCHAYCPNPMEFFMEMTDMVKRFYYTGELDESEEEALLKLIREYDS